MIATLPAVAIARQHLPPPPNLSGTNLRLRRQLGTKAGQP